MRKSFTLIITVFLTTILWAQSPDKISYQAVIRDNNNALVTDQNIGIQISILRGSASGSSVYVETQTPSTNSNGLVSIEIGSGTTINGNFSTIDWANGSYFIKTEIDPAGGLDYSITGTSQLLSVPYALHSKTAETVIGGITETDPSVPTGNHAGDMQYWNGTEWVTIPATSNEGATLQMIEGIPTWTGGTPSTSNSISDVTNPTTGKIWMDRNLGASQVATSSTDSEAYGDLYQWGRAADGHQLRTSGTTNDRATGDTPGHSNFIVTTSWPTDWRTTQNRNLWQGVNGTNNPCPSGYRLPTKAEWDAEIATWSNPFAEGAISSPLKLPMAGIRSGLSGNIGNEGEQGSYWSSTWAINGNTAHHLSFSNTSGAFTYGHLYSSHGYPIRCIKN